MHQRRLGLFISELNLTSFSLKRTNIVCTRPAISSPWKVSLDSFSFIFLARVPNYEYCKICTLENSVGNVVCHGKVRKNLCARMVTV